MRRSALFVIGGVITALVLTGCADGESPATSRSAAPPRTTASPTPTASAAAPHQERVRRALAGLEREYDATVGVVATDTVTGETVAYNGDRRFGYASTIKAFAAAQFLRSVPADARNEVVHWTAADVAAAGYSPVTEQHVADGLSYEQLAEAAVRMSDNTALNLVLTRIGGPSGLDAALTELGDTTTEVVHGEPDLNTIEPGSTEDTTTPAAFTAALTTVLDGSTLDRADTALLVDWMGGNATGDALIRAGAPDGWVVVDKSGGAGPIRNDVARVTPPGGDPIVLSVLTTRNDPDAAYDDALVARSASAVLDAFDR
ncbi:beta-lactamase class A [Curtobacterium sp. PhB142]|uniref:class A beta-lactamase n=1 Tax=unclassified Curtobacterium TaxID=257496 RepID=UPI001050B1AD|nr:MULTISPECIES: class A beta-lactamase [unclassified Curtobacterium]TCL88194.1 beta-lactamase class A [Curtobacterium sp. PhB142]TCM00136.1 beta-lactamase class A [Curtobacterium sp. PhB134]